MVVLPTPLNPQPAVPASPRHHAASTTRKLTGFMLTSTPVEAIFDLACRLAARLLSDSDRLSMFLHSSATHPFRDTEFFSA